MNYKTMKIEDIIKWCQDNNEVEWLKAKAAEKVDYKVYPTIKVAKVDENGNPVLSKKGKQLFANVADKSKEPAIEKRPITFIQIKQAFCEKFMPEIMPKSKAKKPSMYEIIKGL